MPHARKIREKRKFPWIPVLILALLAAAAVACFLFFGGKGAPDATEPVQTTPTETTPAETGSTEPTE